MRKILLLILSISVTLGLVACDDSQILCGAGTMIKDGQCVAAEIEDDTITQDPVEVSCDSITGEIFYEVDFNTITFVDNESGNSHTASNFVVWGGALETTSVSLNALVIDDLQGTYSDAWHEVGLGYQFFNFENDVTYTVCAIIQGTDGEKVTSELGIYYGHGQKDDVELTGEKQMIVQEYTPFSTTNTANGQYIIFLGNLTGEFVVHSIKIIQD